MKYRHLKSVHITNYYHKDSGGISTAYNKLLEAADKHQRYVRLIVPGETSTVEEVNDFARIYFVKAMKSPVVDSRYRLLTPLDYLPSGSPIREILLAEMPDIIEIGEKYLISLLAGIIRTGHIFQTDRPMLVHFSHERMDDNLGAFVSAGKMSRWFSRQVIGNYILPMFDYHLANSDYTASELIENGHLIDNNGSPNGLSSYCYRKFKASGQSVEKTVRVSNCGSDFDFFSKPRRDLKFRSSLLDEAGFPPGSTIVLYAGRISPEKNVALIPKIFELLERKSGEQANDQKFRLLILGDGPKRQWLEDELGRIAPANFKIFGHLTDKVKLAGIYANSDVFIHPNPHEPFGIGPLEAMASGLPVVLPNAGGVLSYANDRNAWLVDADPHEFVSAIQEALTFNPLRAQRIQNAKFTADRNSWVVSTNRLFRLYDHMYADFRAADHDLKPPAADIAADGVSDLIKIPLTVDTASPVAFR